ncbi:intersectin-EH binding protein Ibp1 [Mycobacteriaceae bacterium 1482268.1]|nr:intersectin-EH binding protein Ibp1 [Mycobacteriaceae bacterium 1482268.1]
MATMKFSARRLIIAGGFAVAVAAAPAIAFVATPTPAATPLAQCPGGEEHDLYTSLCIPHLVPNAGQPYQAIGGNSDLAAVTVPGAGGAGIPCTGHNSGQCIGLAEEDAAMGPQPVPRSTVGSSPTVTGSTGSVG